MLNISLSLFLSGVTCSRRWLSVCGWVWDGDSDPGEIAGRDAEWGRHGEGEASRRKETISDRLNCRHVVTGEASCFCHPSKLFKSLQVLISIMVVGS